jgi:hypothetical protein
MDKEMLQEKLGQVQNRIVEMEKEKFSLQTQLQHKAQEVKSTLE